MADTAAAKSPAKKRSTKTKKPASHPKYIDMIKKAIIALKERGGSSRQAIQKFIVQTYKVDEKQVSVHLKVALRNGVKNKTLKQSKGTGASGSFKLGDKATGDKAAAKPKTKKPKTKKVKKPKAAGVKKTKSPAKKTKKTKKPAAKKSPAKKPAAKKSPAKKTAKKPASKSKKAGKGKKK